MVTRPDDIVAIEKNKASFVNSDEVKGGCRPNIQAEASMISTDDPLRSARRILVSRRFVLRAVTALRDHMGETVYSITRLAHMPHVEMPDAFVYGLRESHVSLASSQ